MDGDVAWPRVVRDGPDVVGFVMAFLDVVWDPEDPLRRRRSGIWRMNVDAAHQSRGHGAFAVRAVCEEIRRRGLAEEAWVTWEPGDDGPQEFYLRLGFELTDESADGQRVGRLRLGPS